MSTAPATRQAPLWELLAHGQSAWYDYIRRSLIESGELARLIEEDALRGITSNPSIWEKAIDGSSDYDVAIAELVSGGERDPVAIYEHLAVEDLRAAAQAFEPAYREAARGDGYVSIEVAPEHAHDTGNTIAEARRLWETIGAENLMVKVPGTPAGIPAIRALTAEGINVNITLLFAVPVYEQVAEAYLSGLEDLAASGGDLSRVASVASFFVSRIDTVVDGRLEELCKRGGPEADGARALQGRVAIANAKLAYAHFRDVTGSERWRALAEQGAHPQRLLWASTGVKNPKYPELLYVEELIGPDTVDTVPPATFDAFREHGRVRDSLEEGVDDARRALADLDDLGISLSEITEQLTADGIDLFEQAFAKLFGAIAGSAASGPSPRSTRPAALPADLDREVASVLSAWQADRRVQRLWSREAAVWTGGDEASWLGWLDLPHDQPAHAARLAPLVEDVRQAGFRDAVVLGMGGSSLFPELLARTFGPREGYPALHVLDSTDPAQVRAVEERVDLASTLFIVSSKSGSTLEPNIFLDYFLARVTEVVGQGEAPKRFVAITDPGSPVETLARERGFRHVAHGKPSVGGRYSALSDFGIVPGAIAGVDVQELLERAERMAHACAPSVPCGENPGLSLGATIGACVLGGRDKVTLIASPAIQDLGAWLEQLLAESTGKHGTGIIPVDREPLGPPDAYGDDRLFAYLRLDGEPDADQDAAVDALEQAGHPVVRVGLADRLDVGSEVFRWEFATAVAGAVIGIDPFDQPDVEAAKVATRTLMEHPDEAAGDEGVPPTTDAVRDLLGSVRPGDYVALLAYVPMTGDHERLLTEIRALIRDRTRVATCAGFGPRYLHSTGQAYKGGPGSGVFLEITAEHGEDLDVPGRGYTFGAVQAAQAAGDLSVLRDRGRRTANVHLGADVAAGLAALREAVEGAL